MAMITKPTVLVLGAGASVPYAFPSGPELARQVCALLSQTGVPGNSFQNTDFSRYILTAFPNEGITFEHLQTFASSFWQSGCESIDEFVQPQGNRCYLTIAKAAIIEVLIRYEQDSAIVRSESPYESTTTDWYGYLFRYMRTPDVGTFAANQVRVITFNFDRSFERRLFLMLRAYYGISDAEASRLRAAIPVLHLHGRLGGEKWLGENRQDSRAFESTASEQQKTDLVGAIRIVHEELNDRDIATAKEWLAEAHTICFLGFGYHRLTLGRLGLDVKLPNARIYGTTLGLSGPELSRIKGDFGNSESLHLDDTRNLDARSYLRDVHVLLTDRG